MARYRKKPVVIDAVCWTGDMEVLRDWLDSLGYNADTAPDMYRQDASGPALSIRTLEGTMRADIGDWIIRGVQHEFYPCKPDIFDSTYERVE